MSELHTPSLLSSPTAGPGDLVVLYRLWSDDRTPRLEFLSPGADQLLEQSAAEFLAHLQARDLPLFGVDAPTFYQAAEQWLNNRMLQPLDFGWKVPRTGLLRWLRFQTCPTLPETVPSHTMGVLLDITLSKQRQDRLQQANRFLSSYFDNSPVGLIEWDHEARVKSWSNQASVIFGWTQEELLGKTAFDFKFIHEDDLARIVDLFEPLFSGREPRNVTFNRNYDRNGRVLHCEWHNTAILDEAGKVVSMLSLVLDVSQRQENLSSRKQEEERLKMMMQTAGVLGWSASPLDWSVDYTQHPAEWFSSFPREPHYDVPEILWPVHPEQRATVLDQISEAIKNRSAFMIEFRGCPTNNAIRESWYAISGQLISPAFSPPRVCGIIQNITERRLATLRREALEAALAEGKERENRNILVGGIAHEFNNLNTIIAGHLELATRSAASDTALIAIREAQLATHRAIELCQQLTQSVGNRRFHPKPVNLHTTIQKVLQELTPLERHRVQYGGLNQNCWVMGEAEQLQKLFLILIRQSLDGNLPDEHPIELLMDRCTRSVVRSGRQWNWKSDQLLRVRLWDSRPIGELPTLAKRFQTPFAPETIRMAQFGPASVKGILDLHQGQLHVLADVAKTLIEILLPCTEEPQQKPQWALLKSDSNSSSARRAIIADDEPNIRELVSQLVEEQGFQVDAVADGQAAIELFLNDPDKYSLVVSDVMMPRCTGWELLKTIRQFRVDLPVLLMTGYNPSQAEAQQPHLNMRLLLKPFQLDDLITSLKVLTSASPSETPSR